MSEWTTGITCLSSVDRSSPQTAFTAFQVSYQPEWQYFQGVVANMTNHFAPVETAIRTSFLPALLEATTPTSTPPELHTLLFRQLGRCGYLQPNRNRCR